MAKGSITDFFKPFAFPRQKKRPPIKDDLEDSRPAQRSRSNIPQEDSSPATQEAPTAKPDDIRFLASQSSTLSSIPSDASSIPDVERKENYLPSRQIIDGTVSARDDGHTTSSQTPVITSSQRRVVNGETVIRDSDDERSDSEVTLEDLDDLFGFRKPALATTEHDLQSLSQSEDESNNNANAVKRNSRGAPVTRQSALSSSTGRPKYKFSLDALVEQCQKDKASQASIEKARTLLQTLTEEKSPPIEGRIGHIDTNLLATVVKDDEESGSVDRLVAAIERTEAVQQERVWSFFDRDVAIVDVMPATKPNVSDPQWQITFEDTVSTQQAFLSGFVGEVAGFAKLPDELITWLLDSACFEEREDLRYSYYDTLRESRDQILDLLTADRIDKLFQNLGAKADALDLTCTVVPVKVLIQPVNDKYHLSKDGSEHSRANQAAVRTKLLSVLKFLHALSGSLSLESRRCTICVLCRLLMDHLLINDSSILSNTEETIAALVESMDKSEFDEELVSTSETVFSSVSDKILQLQLLQYFPASSLRLNLFRRRLALAFFFEDRSYLSRDLTDLINFDSIVRYLKEPRFAAYNSHSYNFSDLAALIAILAVGVDNGNPPPPESSREADVAFNEGVDMLARRIKKMFTQIVDSGASHKKRTEAKEVLEAFHSILLCSVRTKQKVNKHLAGDPGVVVELQKQRALMHDHFGKGGQTEA